jgi:hypothetical protein
MLLAFRRSLLTVAVLVCSTGVFMACSAAKLPETGPVATSGADAAAIGVETSDLYVRITNNAGRPLEEVRVAIRVVGNAPPFMTTVRRMENGEKRDLSPNSFRSNDGTTFSPRLHRARQVSVNAVDVAGQKYEVAKAWTR